MTLLEKLEIVRDYCEITLPQLGAGDTDYGTIFAIKFLCNQCIVFNKQCKLYMLSHSLHELEKFFKDLDMDFEVFLEEVVGEEE